MKQLPSYIKKIFSFVKKLFFDKEYWMYTLIFFGLMMGTYLYFIYAGMAKAPEFTYAEF